MAFNWNKFPWTNFHDLNLDWIIQKVRELEIKVLDAAHYTDRKINDLLTGVGDLEIDKTGTVRISGGAVDLSNARMTTDFDMAEHRIINVGAPVSGTDAATKAYVDSHTGGQSGGDTVLQGTATFNSDSTITHVEGVDYSSVAAAALTNKNILLVLTASNVEETYMVMRYVGKKQLATSGSNRYRYTFISAESIGDFVSNVYGLDFDEGDDPMREKDTYFISRGVCDFYVTGTASQDGALESVTFLSGWTKEEFDSLLAQGARIRLVVTLSGPKYRYFEMCYTTGSVTAFGGMYIDGNQSANIQIITYNGTTFSTASLAPYGGETA